MKAPISLEKVIFVLYQEHNIYKKMGMAVKGVPQRFSIAILKSLGTHKRYMVKTEPKNTRLHLFFP